MKKIALLFLMISVLACNNAPSSQTAPAVATPDAAPSSSGINTNEYVMEKAENGLSLATKQDANGNIIEQGFIRDGKKEGAWKIYERNYDFPKFIISYVDGQLNGPYFEYTAHGQVEVQSNYKDGKLHGHWGQYKLGKVIKTAHYVNGLMDGIYRELNQKDASPKVEAMYKMGKQDGPMKYYNDKGEVVLEYTFKNGEKVGEAKVTKH